MGFSQWLLRCIPGLSLIILFIFLECTLGLLQQIYRTLFYPTAAVSYTSHHILLWLLCSYSFVLHLASLYFPLRLCWATWHAIQKIEALHREDFDDDSTQVGSLVDDDSIKSLNLDHTEPIDAVQVTMAIIIPAYKEDISTMEDTLCVLGSHPMARESYHIFLAMEERDLDARRVAQSLITTFDQKFLRMQYTVHPAGIEGEAPGKSSNVSWAAKEVERCYTGSPHCRNVLITTMDSDTHLLPQYFQCVTDAHHRNRKSGYLTDMTLYMPPIIFDRNAHTVPRLVRMADLMWCGAGLSCFLPKHDPISVGIPTAVYTIPLALAQLVDGWDTGPSAIGEDMHMMLKCYFATNGCLNIESIPSPASQCNITTDIKGGIRGWIAGHNARYNQGLRHMWGCLDTGFALSKWLHLGRSTSPQCSPVLRPNPVAGKVVTQRPRKLSHTELSLKLSQYALHGSEPRRWTWRNLLLATRMFEAHFLPAHLVTVVVASALFTSRVTWTDDLKWAKLCLGMTEYMRMLGFAIMIVYFASFYDKYHKVGIQAREREMLKAGLHEQLSSQFSHRNRWTPGCWIDHLLFPVAGTIFGSLCLFQAAFSHLYTDKLVYLVSAKPVRALLSAAKETVPITDEKMISLEKAV